jgi:4-aminobutyrate aminotransferase-like enzyme
VTEAIKIARDYFDLSNKSDFSGIRRLFAETTTYSSQTTGVYLGREDILAMQQAFHGKFTSLHWKVNSAEEVKPGIILFDYDFMGELPNGEKIESSGLEYVIVYRGKIQHIEIRSKTA